METPRLVKIFNGWAAHGDGWAIHAATREDAIRKYRDRSLYYEELKSKPFWYENPENPKFQKEIAQNA